METDKEKETVPGGGNNELIISLTTIETRPLAHTPHLLYTHTHTHTHIVKKIYYHATADTLVYQ